MILICPTCGSKVVTPRGVGVDSVPCGHCGTLIDASAGMIALEQSYDAISMERLVARHGRFNERLKKILVIVWLVLMGLAIAVRDEVAHGPAPPWLDVLFLAVAPILSFGVVWVLYRGISRRYARSIGLSCPVCHAVLSDEEATLIASSRQCPRCAVQIDPADFIA